MGQPENFIPWEQIEPLVRPGMTRKEFTTALRKHLGLSPGTYGVITQVGGGALGMKWFEAVKYGLLVVKRDSPEFRASFDPGPEDEVAP